ncbi:MAG: electron transport complex subunit RsxC [Gammaproteobacteria bacterium]|nr:electron transport complex subunit RsxC [Gammaproteobacteria bacterium]
MADVARPGGPDLHHFPGGLALEDRKAMATRLPLETASLPAEVVLPLRQHIGQPAVPLVAVGDKVHKGQPVAEADGRVSAFVHAPTSGEVIAIELHDVPHPTGLQQECIVIRADGEDSLGSNNSWPYQGLEWNQADPADIRSRIREAGVVGLGGAVFPTEIKVDAGNYAAIDSLVINGAECEPYISCDDTLMRHAADEVIRGTEILQRASGAVRCIIAIEDNKPEAGTAMEEALRAAKEANPDLPIALIAVPSIYPEGGEKQLIQVLTGREVPADGLPQDIGVICHNVGTAVAARRAVEDGEPLIRRIVTVTGEGVAEPRNLEARLGTPFSSLVRDCGGYTEDVQRLIMGGPMMGFALQHDEIPVTKATNCILLPSSEEIAPPTEVMPCIRCGECAAACPASLLPQQLYWHTRSRDFDAVEEHALFDCIECGCCDVVCPSHIPLASHFRFAKTEIWGKEIERAKSDIARQRFEARQARLEREKLEQEEKRKRKQEALKKLGDAKDRKAEIDAALERVKSRRGQPPTTNQEQED